MASDCENLTVSLDSVELYDEDTQFQEIQHFVLNCMPLTIPKIPITSHHNKYITTAVISYSLLIYITYNPFTYYTSHKYKYSFSLALNHIVQMFRDNGIPVVLIHLRETELDSSEVITSWSLVFETENSDIVIDNL